MALVFLNYFLGFAIEHSERRRKTTFIISVSINIIVLAFFKYFGFLESLFIDIKELSTNDHMLNIILPVGLSFFIFTTLGYLIEVKRGIIKAERHLGIFASSLLFFPKIMLGPIEKPWNLFPQFRQAKSFDYEMIVSGLKQILWGYFKKLVVADRLAIYINNIYGSYEQHSGLSLLLATFFFSFQIYADFSGYTDIALGSAKVLGINLTNNFSRPYFATSIREFWSRWHISLSIWFRDYLYLPLFGFFTGKVKKARYLGLASEKWISTFVTIISFSIYGLWHGAKLNFLLWGLIFSIYLTFTNWNFAIDRNLWKKLGITKSSRTYRIYRVIITFILITFTWIFFRADTTHDAFMIIKSIFNLKGPLLIDKTTIVYSLIGLVTLIYIELKRENKQAMENHLPLMTKHWLKEHLAYVTLIILILLIGVFDGEQFIYFQF